MLFNANRGENQDPMKAVDFMPEVYRNVGRGQQQTPEEAKTMVLAIAAAGGFNVIEKKRTEEETRCLVQALASAPSSQTSP